MRLEVAFNLAFRQLLLQGEHTFCRDTCGVEIELPQVLQGIKMFQIDVRCASTSEIERRQLRESGNLWRNCRYFVDAEIQFPQVCELQNGRRKLREFIPL